MAFPRTRAPFITIPNWPFPSFWPFKMADSGKTISFLFCNQSGKILSSPKQKSSFSFLSLFCSTVLFKPDPRVETYLNATQVISKRHVTIIVMCTRSGKFRLTAAASTDSTEITIGDQNYDHSSIIYWPRRKDQTSRLSYNHT